VTIWVDAQLSPAIAEWISVNFSVPAVALRDLGLRDETDRAIFLRGAQGVGHFDDEGQRFSTPAG